MKKILATAAALSLMLIACGDESSSTAPDQQAAGGKKTNASSSYHPGECRTDIACARNEAGRAYLISEKNDGYQVVVPFVQFPRSAWIDGDFFSERSGDTLYVLMTGTLTRFFFASSTPLAMAAVTSLAFPRP